MPVATHTPESARSAKCPIGNELAGSAATTQCPSGLIRRVLSTWPVRAFDHSQKAGDPCRVPGALHPSCFECQGRAVGYLRQFHPDMLPRRRTPGAGHRSGLPSTDTPGIPVSGAQRMAEASSLSRKRCAAARMTVTRWWSNWFPVGCKFRPGTWRATRDRPGRRRRIEHHTRRA
jgi:hypothetical protein